MNQYYQDQHQYTNQAYTNLSLRPWTAFIFNSLRGQAKLNGIHCGMVMDSLITHVSKKVNPHFTDKSWGIITRNFSNTSHVDDDWNYTAVHDVSKAVLGSDKVKLKEYLTRFWNTFPNIRNRLPHATSCNWVEEDYSTTWKRYQYFVLVDFGLVYDLSSDLFNSNERKQLSATFYGSLFYHLTSRALWISSDGVHASTVKPEGASSLFAWGEYKSQKKK